MEIRVENGDSSSHGIVVDENAPLLEPQEADEKSLVQRAISQTFQSVAHLANRLPTGAVLAFQLLGPIFSNAGHCDAVGRSLTASLVAACGLSCFVLSFTDSFKDRHGNVCYGLATPGGLWVIDGSSALPPELAEKYRVRFIDFMHAVMSVLVFAAVALFDQNVVNCFYPTPSVEAREVLTAVPVGIGVFCSMLFVVFPTKRHGIGFPLTAES
ncbi:unnamed protein product [Cuscuta campestris]|uniref:DUF679 domain-containing protein n=1 Tax=Cuscuta campestris TaxID=132261 RepID=A0A484M0N5_9ASTE|nr:unnamed protein product [Cuscuta campestris]